MSWSLWAAQIALQPPRTGARVSAQRLVPQSSHPVKHSLKCCGWEPAILSPAFVQGYHHRGGQSQETKAWVSLEISSKGQLQMSAAALYLNQPTNKKKTKQTHNKPYPKHPLPICLSSKIYVFLYLSLFGCYLSPPSTYFPKRHVLGA